MEPTFMRDAHGNSFWVTKTFMQPEINLDPASDPLALDVKPKPEPSSVKLDPGTEPDPLDTSVDSVRQLETTETDPLALEPKPELFIKQEPGLPKNPDTDSLDNHLPKTRSLFQLKTVKHESTATSRSPPRFVPLRRSTRQARSIEPSAMNITTEPPSDKQDSLPQGILPDSRSAEDESSSVFNEAPQPAVARSDSTDNQVFDSVSSPCRSDCVDSEYRDDDSIQLTSDTSLAVKYNLKQCSVSLRRVSLSFTHTAPGIVSDRSPFQSSGKEFRSTSRRRKRRRNPNSIIFSCKVCFRTYTSSDVLRIHERVYPQPHFACDKCKRICSDKSEIDNHYRINHVTVTCSVCDKIFSSKASLNKHSSIHDVVKPCKVCGKSFKRKLELEKHMMSHTKEFKCAICEKSFVGKIGLSSHIFKHLSILEFKCDVCGTVFATQKYLNAHKKRHTHSKQYPCAECNKVFLSKKGFMSHRSRQHWRPSDWPGFPCPCCSSAFSSEEELTNHLKSRGLYCVSCGLACKDNSSMRAHLIDVHGGKDEKYHSCRTCGKRCKSKEKLTKHEKMHIVTPFRCLICPNSFMTKNSLELHVKRNHFAEYSCDICAKSFKYKKAVKNHLHTHSKPIQCNICKIMYSTKRVLSYHMSTQHSIGPVTDKYTCAICSRSLKDIIQLKKHQRVHTKPFKCPELKCGKSFSKKDMLMRHQENHIVEKTMKCEHCDKSFALMCSFKIHMEGHVLRSIVHTCNDCGESFKGRTRWSNHIIAQVHSQKRL